jgi:hypothetical protein
MFCKLLDDHRALVCYDLDNTTDDYATLNDNAAFLDAMPLSGRSGTFDVYRIPMYVEYDLFEDCWVYYTYTNSLILNDQVFVPIYDISYDDIALSMYESLMPTYDIVPIDCSSIIAYGGAIHCITMQYPDIDALPIKSVKANLPDLLKFSAAPNPFNSTTEISLLLPKSHTSKIVEIFDITGHKVRSLANLPSESYGNFTFTWDGCDDSHTALSSGTYQCKIQFDNTKKTINLLLIK